MIICYAGFLVYLITQMFVAKWWKALSCAMPPLQRGVAGRRRAGRDAPGAIATWQPAVVAAQRVHHSAYCRIQEGRQGAWAFNTYQQPWTRDNKSFCSICFMFPFCFKLCVHNVCRKNNFFLLMVLSLHIADGAKICGRVCGQLSKIYKQQAFD